MAVNMSCNGIDAGTAEDPACAQTHPNLLGDENHKLFRRRLGILAILLLLVNLTIGFSAHRQQRSLADYSIGVYDTTILSTNYILKSTAFCSRHQSEYPHFLYVLAIEDEFRERIAF